MTIMKVDMTRTKQRTKKVEGVEDEKERSEETETCQTLWPFSGVELKPAQCVLYCSAPSPSHTTRLSLAWETHHPARTHSSGHETWD